MLSNFEYVLKETILKELDKESFLIVTMIYVF